MLGSVASAKKFYPMNECFTQAGRHKVLPVFISLLSQVSFAKFKYAYI